MINFYNKLPKEIKQETKLDKNFNDHFILPNSMIAIIGGTGSCKSNALLNLISKQSNKYYDIIIFNPVSTDEPLLKLLHQKIPELKLVSDINPNNYTNKLYEQKINFIKKNNINNINKDTLKNMISGENIMQNIKLLLKILVY